MAAVNKQPFKIRNIHLFPLIKVSGAAQNPLSMSILDHVAFCLLVTPFNKLITTVIVCEGVGALVSRS